MHGQQNILKKDGLVHWSAITYRNVYLGALPKLRKANISFVMYVQILSTPSFVGEVKPSVPCHRFAACKRSLELRGSRILDEICRNISRPQRFPPSAARGILRRWT